MEIWLSDASRPAGGAIQLPILPASFNVTMANTHQTVNVQTKGDVTVLGKAGLREVELTSFFPAHDYPFASCARTMEPYDYVSRVLGWQEDVVRLTITDTNINMETIITSFSYGEPDASGDVEFSLSMQEYRKPTYTTPSGSNSIFGSLVEVKKTTTIYYKGKYTVKKGDTLRSISKKIYGTGSKYLKIYNANKTTIEKAAKKNGKKSSSNKGIKGYWLYQGTKLVIPTVSV